MYKSDLEKIIFEINQKLDEGVTVVLKDYRERDAIKNGFIAGIAFAVGNMAVQEIRIAHSRRQYKKWVNEERKKS